MELHLDQVPSDEVWAVVMDAPAGTKDVEWFITAEAAKDDYKDVVAYVRHKGGTVERWHVTLPAQRMEADAVTLWVEALLLSEDRPRPEHARRLDIFRK
jgi:hypothetical protein